MSTVLFEVDKVTFTQQALSWAQQYDQICYLQSNGHTDTYGAVDAILAVGALEIFESKGKSTFEELENFKTKHPNQWMFGFFGYDLKNEIENLSTSFPNPLGFPDAYFFVPQLVLRFSAHTVEITGPDPEQFFSEIGKIRWDKRDSIFAGNIRTRMSKTEYLHAFDQMKAHIQRGDIYEVNLCQEFYAERVIIDPLQTYLKLNEVSPTPFSTFVKIKDKYILSASPERFLAKRGQTLISQPIKGTAPRGRTDQEDRHIVDTLANNPKEIAENVMIVDLVRNDMTRSALPGSVAAERTLEIKSYSQVHQLVSTITCTKAPRISDIEAIKHIFPPGSMTGAPKISAMELCDRYERSRRGVYSGTVGYFAPDGDFDFNVIIRTILYNSSNQYLSFHTGGAITVDSDGEKEYEECLLKASAILSTLDRSL